MRSEQEFLAEYARSHRNSFNQRMHMICVPAIFMATLGLFWLVPVGAWLGLSGTAASWVNLATVSVLPVLWFYARLSGWALRTGVIWLAASFVVILLMQQLGMALFAPLLALWLVAWAGQFWGHKVEGMKPSFADDLVFLLIGPLFVQQKWQRQTTV